MTDDALARVLRHRQELSDVLFIAITGSCGKTTTKDLTAAILGKRFRGSKNDDTRNCGADVAAAILAVRPDDYFFVQELGAWGPGTLDTGIQLVQPDIAVVTNLRNDHYSSLRGPRGAQAEKGKLVKCLPRTGTAVLNSDDDLVRELRSWTNAPTFSFGCAGDDDLRAADVTAAWPQTLSFTACHGRLSKRVHTQLVGEHLLGSALAALSVAIVCGMDFGDACDALMVTKPTFRRMSADVHADGVTFIRDDWKAPLDSVDDGLGFMQAATASRKIAVLGTISDYPGRSRRVYSQVASDCLRALHTAIFVGDRAADLWGEHRVPVPADQLELRQQLGRALDIDLDGELNAAHGQMLVFREVRDAAAFTRGFFRAGDLVLVKASGPADHLERVILDREEPATCWEAHCGRLYPCDMCEVLRSGRRAFASS
jgi:UDP-N-acetylmuramyl pentapeptide synthase